MTIQKGMEFKLYVCKNELKKASDIASILGDIADHRKSASLTSCSLVGGLLPCSVCHGEEELTFELLIGR